MIGKTLPNVTFKTRLRDESLGGPNPYRWVETTTADYFAGKRVVLFSLPGAFTPPARLTSFQSSRNCTRPLPNGASTRSSASRSTTPSS